MAGRIIFVGLSQEDYRHLSNRAKSLGLSISGYGRLMIRIGYHQLSKDPKLLDIFVDETYTRKPSKKLAKRRDRRDELSANLERVSVLQ